MTKDKLFEAMEENEFCGFCEHGKSPHEYGETGMYWVRVCDRYEVPIVVNDNYSTCENWKKKK